MPTILTDTSISDAQKEARLHLKGFLEREAPARNIASLASSIHCAICEFERIHRRVTIRPEGIRWQRLSSPMAATDALERLNTQKDYLRAKAFKELPPVAMDLLGIAAQKVTGEPLARMMARWRPYPRNDVVMHIPDWNDINRLLSTARQLCGRDNDSRSTRKVERDAAVISILRVYQLIYMTPPTVKTVRPFIEKIERFYSGILPRKGFGVLRSAKVLQGLIDAAR